MILRQITLATEPPQTFTLYFDSRSNAEKVWAQSSDAPTCMELIDDYKQVIPVLGMKFDLIVADLITDLSEKFRADGEIECVKMHAEMKFADRVDKDAILKAQVNKKRAQQMMQNAQRDPTPPGLAS